MFLYHLIWHPIIKSILESVLSFFRKASWGFDLTFRKRKPSGFCESEITKVVPIIAWSLVEEPAATFNPCHGFSFSMRETKLRVLCFSSFPQSPRAIGNPRKRRRPILFSLPLVDFWFSLIPSRLSSVIREKLSVSLFLFHSTVFFLSFFFALLSLSV